MNTVKKNILAILIVVILCGVTFLYTKQHYESRTDEQVVKVETIIDTTVTITGETIRDGLKDIGELATEEYFFTRVENYDNTKSINNFKIPFTRSKFVYSYDGMVKAGIDFADISVEKDDLKKIITITIPKSRILDCSIDTDTFKLYDEKNSAFNQFSITDFNDTLDKMMDAAKEDAIKKGVLDRADRNAKLLLKNFVMSTYDIDDFYIDIVTE